MDEATISKQITLAMLEAGENKTKELAEEILKNPESNAMNIVLCASSMAFITIVKNAAKENRIAKAELFEVCVDIMRNIIDNE